jgi:putative transposase
MLDQHGFIPSMSGKDNCYDNAMVETVFKTIKSELVWRTSLQSCRRPKMPSPDISTAFIIPSAGIRPLATKAP